MEFLKPVCLIPARGGSKGVPKKNIRLLAGKSLISYAIEAALKSKIFQSVIVSTEDKKIAKIAKKFGADVPFKRPSKLSTDQADTDRVVYHAIRKLYSLGYNFEILVLRDCTVPFIKNSDIQKSINLLKRKNCDVVCGVYRQHHNPYYNLMEINSRGFLELSKKPRKKITGRQQAPIVYQLNGLFAINVNQFLKYKRIFMPKILPYEISLETGLMIDTKFEFQIADQIAKKQIKI